MHVLKCIRLSETGRAIVGTQLAHNDAVNFGTILFASFCKLNTCIKMYKGLVKEV